MKKRLFEKVETRRAVLISLMVTLLLIAVEGIRWVVEYALTTFFHKDAPFAYFVGLCVALIIILSIIVRKYEDLLQ